MVVNIKMVKKKTVTDDAPVIDDSGAAPVEAPPIQENTSKDQLIAILESAPRRHRNLNQPGIDPEYLFSTGFDSEYAAFLQKLRSFAECL
jgi:hypothetical protein